MKEVVLVVGGGNGIGKRAVDILSDTGENVYVADKEPGIWKEDTGSAIICKEVDVLDNTSLTYLIQDLKTRQLKLRGLVYTVGEALTKPVNSMKPSDYESLLQLNTIAFLNMLGLFDFHDLFCQDGASVVVISSLVASTGVRGKVGNAASKGALEAAVKTLAIEFVNGRIRINAIALGTLQTEMLDKLISKIGLDAVNDLAKDYPLGLGDTEDVANLIPFLMKDASKWMTGNVYILDGAFSSK